MISVPDLDKEKVALLAGVDKKMRELEIVRFILTNIPVCLGVLDINMALGFGFECDGSLLLNAETELDALKAFRGLDLLPVVKHKDKTSAFLPLESAEKNRKKYNADHCIDAGKVTYDIEFFGGQYYNNYLNAYIKIGDYIVKLRADIKKPLTRMSVAFEQTPCGEIATRDGSPLIAKWQIVNEDKYFQSKAVWGDYGKKTNAEVTLFRLDWSKIEV